LKALAAASALKNAGSEPGPGRAAQQLNRNGQLKRALI